ncbi:MAG: Cro/Cl family transcriptional regulator [Firmicutes bacterium HGW-Firmicutes-11]|jgi:putative transcriptional regulator|nr:MAG: Cro/Cl family transcriptional regulator [Firmicutes bacterium HGW-Firmicutes-11]
MIVNKFSSLLGDRLIRVSEVSKETGISRTTITNLYYRKNDSISLKNLDKLCSYLSCSVGDLLEYRKEEQ